ncbi:MAG TPA: dihydroneopterin aldolase [Armatimonadota bacterium]|nr:dihydroneopterin aldolase [Armatimonadota bacterium]HOP79413.1 dihydroneopterin aldolase [Armatimonadota bacterium]HPP73541.1 dihydroneopterin aldolase [Armatimonadota bacterium]
MDKIFIKDLLARAIIGVREEERREKQDVILNIVLWIDLSKPGKTDDFKDAVDYSMIKHQVLNLVENSYFYLVEALAEHVAGLCLENPAVQQVQVTVEKPSALRFARSVGVEITRSRQ